MGEQKIKQNIRPSIFEFHNYRNFLRDWFAYIKLEKGTSMRKIAFQSGLASGYLPMVISAKRNLSEEALINLQPHLGLDDSEFKFLYQLRILEDDPSRKAKQKAFETIKRYMVYKDKNSKEIEIHRYLNKWYYVAIREMVNLPDFQMDAVWIRKKLKKNVSKREVQKALDFLVKEGYIIFENGKPRQAEKQVMCEGGIYKLSMAEYHEQLLGVAIDSIYETASEDRNLMAHTLAIPKEKFDEIRDVMNDAIQKIIDIGDKASNSEDVYQVSLLAFPLTEREGGKK